MIIVSCNTVSWKNLATNQTKNGINMFKKTIFLTMIILIIFIQQICFAESSTLNGIWIIDQTKTINELTKYQNENKVKDLLYRSAQPLAWQCMMAIEINDEIVNLNSTLKKELIDSDKKQEYKLFSQKNNTFEYISTDNDKPFDKFKIEYVDDINIKMYHSDKDGFDKILWKRANSDEINLSSKETSKIFEEWLKKIFALKSITENKNH